MRASGILMPVSSLPGPFGIGTLGKEAFAFVDFLAKAKQTYWQILPIGPTGYGDSPYQSFSAFAGNPYFIDFRLLAADGYLTAEELPAAQPVDTVDYGALYNQRPVLLKKAVDRLLAAPSPAYEAFCAAQQLLAGGLRPVHGREGCAGAGRPCRLAERTALPRAGGHCRRKGTAGRPDQLPQGSTVLLLHPVERAQGLRKREGYPSGG